MSGFRSTLLFLVILTFAAHGETVIHLHSESEVEGERVTLGDVAVIESENGDSSLLGDIPLVAAPGFGQSLTLRRPFILQAIRANREENSPFVLEGASEVEVKKTGRFVSPEDLLAAIDRFVQEGLVPQELETEVEWTRTPQPVPVSGDVYEIEVQPLSDDLRGMVHFRLFVKEPGAVACAVPATVTVRQFDYAIVAGRGVPRGATLSAHDLMPDRVEVSRLSINSQANLIHSLDEAVGKETRTSIPAGRPIEESMLVEPNAIDSGDPITIELRRGCLRVSAIGVARQSGVIGEVIRVENRATGRTHYGVISAPGRVSLQ